MLLRPARAQNRYTARLSASFAFCHLDLNHVANITGLLAHRARAAQDGGTEHVISVI